MKTVISNNELYLLYVVVKELNIYKKYRINEI